MRRQISSGEDSNEDSVDVTLMEALAQCYQASDTWQKRRQILSILADKVRFTKLLRYIPCLTNYRFTDAKRHCLTYGRGGPVKSLRASRRDIASSQTKPLSRSTLLRILAVCPTSV